jgi:MoaE-MoaD fusion protein
LRVRVLMFGALAEKAAGRDEFEIEDGATTQHVVEAVRARYPEAASILDRCSVAVDEVVVDASFALSPGSEVALLPPMSGGTTEVALCEDPSVTRALAAASSPAAGGTAVFVGTVRDHCDSGVVERLEYSAYHGMALTVLSEIAAEATIKWNLAGIAIEHSVGSRPAAAVTFVVVCTAAHRGEAFDACRYVVDEVKRRAPIWKKEIGPWGARWVGL